MEPEELTQHIGRTLRQLRIERGLSLDQLSAYTTVSKPMLGQIERGESNPTVVTLWKIARGLDIPLSVFLADKPTERATVIRRAEQQIVLDDGGLYVMRHVLSAHHPLPYDLFHVQLLPGCHHQSEPHSVGVQESVLVTHGHMTIRVESVVYELDEGEAMHFYADVDHAYINTTQSVCNMLSFISYSSISARLEDIRYRKLSRVINE